MSDDNSEHAVRYSDLTWPMCGRPRELSCDACSRAGKPCYCDGGKP